MSASGEYHFVINYCDNFVLFAAYTCEVNIEGAENAFTSNKPAVSDNLFRALQSFMYLNE